MISRAFHRPTLWLTIFGLLAGTIPLGAAKPPSDVETVMQKAWTLEAQPPKYETTLPRIHPTRYGT